MSKDHATQETDKCHHLPREHECRLLRRIYALTTGLRDEVKEGKGCPIRNKQEKMKIADPRTSLVNVVKT